MRRALAVLAVLAAAKPAHASSCGSSSGGSSSSSSSSSSDSSSSSSDSSSSSEPVTPACVDDTDVVGFRKCKEYGVWARATMWPRIFVELGTNVRQFGSGLGARTGSVTHGTEHFAFRTIMAEPTSDTAVLSSTRVGVNLGHSYLAGELELGGLASPAAATAEMMASGPSLEQGGGFAVGGLAVAGYRARLGPAAISVEGAAGARSVRYHFASAYRDCAQTASIVETTGILEARARSELWLSPWVSAGATVGTSVISRGDWMAGLYLGLHTRAFGGSR